MIDFRTINSVSAITCCGCGARYDREKSNCPACELNTCVSEEAEHPRPVPQATSPGLLAEVLKMGAAMVRNGIKLPNP